MRLRYAERAAALQSAAETYWDGLLDLPTIEAGLDVTAMLPPGINDKNVAEAAAKAGISVLPLSRYTVKPNRRGGLVLGFSGISPTMIRRGAKDLAQVVHLIKSR